MRGTPPLRDTTLIAAAESLALPTGLITAAFLTRRLGPADYGMLSITAGVVTWLQWTIASWARPAVKAVASSPQPLETAAEFLRVYFWTGVVTALILLLSADAVAAALANRNLAELLRWYAVDVALFSMTHGYRSVHAGLGLYRGRAWGTATRWILRLVLVVIAVGSGFGVLGAIFANIGASTADLLINRFRTPVRFTPKWTIPRHIFTQSSPLLVNGILLRLLERLDLFFLSALGVGQIAVGAYGAAQNLSVVGGIVTASASPVLLSTLARTVRDGDSTSARVLGTTTVRAALATLPLFCVAAVNASFLARKIFGSEFEFIGPAMALLILVIPGTILLSFLQCVLIAFNRPQLVVQITGCLLVGAAAAHAILIPRMGAQGAALTTLVGVYSACAASAVATSRLGLEFPMKTAWRSGALSAIVLTVAPMMGPPTWVKVASLIAATGFLQLLLEGVLLNEWQAVRQRMQRTALTD